MPAHSLMRQVLWNRMKFDMFRSKSNLAFEMKRPPKKVETCVKLSTILLYASFYFWFWLLIHTLLFNFTLHVQLRGRQTCVIGYSLRSLGLKYGSRYLHLNHKMLANSCGQGLNKSMEFDCVTSRLDFVWDMGLEITASPTKNTAPGVPRWPPVAPKLIILTIRDELHAFQLYI